MINAAIVTNPVDIGVERPVGVSVNKDRSDDSGFASVLQSSIRDDQPTVRRQDAARDGEQREQGETMEQEASALPEGNADAKALPNEAAEQVAAQIVGAAISTAVEQKAAGEMMALAVGPAIDETPDAVQGQSAVQSADAGKAVVLAPEFTVARVQPATDGGAVAEAVREVSGALEDEAHSTDLPMADDVESGTDSDTPARARRSFLGLEPRLTGQARADEVRQSNQNGHAYAFGQLGNSKEATRDADIKDGGRAASSAVKGADPLHAAREALQIGAQVKPAVEAPKDLSSVVQAFKILGEEMFAGNGKVTAVDSAGKLGGEANSALNSGDTQNGTFMAPAGRVSFDTVVKGLETAQQPQTPNPPDTELRARIIDQVVREVRLRQFQGQSDIMVKLNPPELGALRLHITQSELGMTSQIHASSDHVRGLLQAHMPALVEALSDAGLKMEQVSITSNASFNSLMQESPWGAAHQQHGKSRQHNSAASQETAGMPAMVGTASAVAAGDSVGYSWLA